MACPTRPVRIVYIIAALVVGGAERQLLLLIKNLDRRIFEPHLIAFASGQWSKFFEEAGIPIVVLPYRFGRIGALVRTIMALRRIRPRIVHTIGQSANYLGRLAAIIGNVPTVIVSERTSPTIKGKAKLLLDRVLSRWTGLLISNSDHGREFYVRGNILPRSKVVTIRNGIEVVDAPERLRSSVGFKLVTIGDLRYEKNHEHLLSAVAKLFVKHPGIEVHLIGDGPLRGMLEKQASELGISDKVIFHGFVDNPRLMLPNFDIYVHTARYEGMPNAVMEAMLFGLPCVACSSSGCMELIKDKETGLLVPQNDLDALVTAIDKLLVDGDLYRLISRSAKRFIGANFSIEEMVGQTVAQYKRLLC